MHRLLREALIEQVSSLSAALQQYPVKGLVAGVGSSLNEEELEALSNGILEERINRQIKAPYMELLQLYAAFHPAMDLLYKAAAAKAEVKDEDVASFILEKLARGISPLRNVTRHLFGRAIKASRVEDALYRMELAFLSEVLAYATDKECQKATVKKDGRVLKGQTEANVTLEGSKDLETFCRRIKRSVTSYALILERLRKKEGRGDNEIYDALAHAGALLYEHTEFISLPVMPASDRAVYRDAIRAYNSDRKRYDRIVAALKDELECMPAYNELCHELKALKERIKAAEAKGGIKYRYMAAQQPYADGYKNLGYNVVLKNSEYYVRLPRVLGSLDKVIGEDAEGTPITGHDRVSSEYTDHREMLCEQVRELSDEDLFALMAYLGNATGDAVALYKGFTATEDKKVDGFEVRCTTLHLTGGVKLSADAIIDGILAGGKDVMMGIFSDLCNNIAAVRDSKKTLDEAEVRKAFKRGLGLLNLKGHMTYRIDWRSYGRKLRLDADEYQAIVKMTRYIKSYRGKHTAQQIAAYSSAVKQARLAQQNELSAVEFPRELTEAEKEYKMYSRTVARRKALQGNRGDYEPKYVRFVANELRKLIK